MKKLIQKWLGIIENESQRPIVIRVESPDFIDQDFTPDIQRSCAGFFKLSLPGRLLVSNLFRDIDELMQEASSTEDAAKRDFLICKAGGQREQLAKILTLCVVEEEKPSKGNDPRTHDETLAALGSEYEIGGER